MACPGDGALELLAATVVLALAMVAACYLQRGLFAIWVRRVAGGRLYRTAPAGSNWSTSQVVS